MRGQSPGTYALGFLVRSAHPLLAALGVGDLDLRSRAAAHELEGKWSHCACDHSTADGTGSTNLSSADCKCHFTGPLGEIAAGWKDGAPDRWLFVLPKAAAESERRSLGIAIRERGWQTPIAAVQIS